MTDLKDGESTEVRGSAAKPYVIRNVGGVYSCSCPAWRNQSTPIERRTCKHIRRLRGDEAEQDRIGSAVAVRPQATGADENDKQGPPLLLAHSWDNSADLAGWWMSEKLDGVRAYWTGREILSRQGNLFHAPAWFIDGLPSVPLDGELWIDRRKFQRTVSIVRRQDGSDLWKEVRFLVFDAPSERTAFERRMETLRDLFAERQPTYARLHPHERCKDLDHLRTELARVESLGGEGLMLREPGSIYEAGRSSTLLKIKSFHDAEAMVIAHQPGKGKHKGKLGALVARLEDGTEFSIGTGLSERDRANPPPVGSLVTFRYQELSDGGVPRFPSFVRASSAPIAAQPTAVPAPAAKARTPHVPAAANNGANRRFELVEGSSSKFWEVSVAGTEVTVRYGRIGATGQCKSKSFSDATSAEAHAAKLIDEKTAKGYAEV